MEIELSMYVLMPDDTTKRKEIILNNLEINEIIEDYLKREYINEKEVLVSFNIK